MKKTLFTALCLGVAIIACNKDNSVVAPSQTHSSRPHNAKRLSVSTVSDTLSSVFISRVDANRMINSYLYSISDDDTDVHSFSVNADSLRAYLANTSIKNIKLIFGHTLSYMNAGYEGQYAGYQSGALTIIIAGYSSTGDYIYYNGNVLDHLAPCPYTCPIGNAGSDLLQ